MIILAIRLIAPMLLIDYLSEISNANAKGGTPIRVGPDVARPRSVAFYALW
jgi:hypothetical protein